MDGPVTLMMQKTLLVKKDQAGNQDAKKMRMLMVVRVLARRRWRMVRVGVGVGWGFGTEGAVGLELGWGRRREGRERWRMELRRQKMGVEERKEAGIGCEGGILGRGEVEEQKHVIR